MARHKKRKRSRKVAKQYWDPPIWVEGHALDEKTGKMKPIRYKLRRRCA